MMRLLFMVLALLSGSAFAEAYYWELSGYSERFDLPADACSFYESLNPPYTVQAPGSGFDTATIYNCAFGVNGQVLSSPLVKRVYRRGDTCPEGLVYNEVTGGCEADCSTRVGTEILTRGPDSPVINDDGYFLVADTVPESVCFQS